MHDGPGYRVGKEAASSPAEPRGSIPSTIPRGLSAGPESSGLHVVAFGGGRRRESSRDLLRPAPRKPGTVRPSPPRRLLPVARRRRSKRHLVLASRLSVGG